jgi:hypothetical protein
VEKSRNILRAGIANPGKSATCLRLVDGGLKRPLWFSLTAEKLESFNGHTDTALSLCNPENSSASLTIGSAGYFSEQ